MSALSDYKQNQKYCSPLVEAMLKGDVELTRELLPQKTEYRGMNCLIAAIARLCNDYKDYLGILSAPNPPFCKTGNIGTCEFTQKMWDAFTVVVKEGNIDVNEPAATPFKDSALNMAVRTGCLPLISFLLIHGADATYIDGRKMDACEVAVMYNYHHVLIYLMHQVPDIVCERAIRQALLYGNFPLIKKAKKAFAEKKKTALVE